MTVTARFKSTQGLMYESSENYALNKKASSNDSLESGAVWSVNNLTDGVTLSTSGNSGYTTNILSSVDIPESERSHIDIDLGENTGFNTVKLYPRTNMTAGDGSTCNFPLSYEIQVRADGEDTWHTVHTVTDAANPMGKPAEVNFDMQSARYVRITVSKVSAGAADESVYHRVQLAEIEVYHVPEKPDDAEFEDTYEGEIAVVPAGTPVTVSEDTLFTAYVTPSDLTDNSLVWSLERVDGTPSDIAMLKGTLTDETTVIPLAEGEVYLVARMANGLSTVSRTHIVIDFDADAVTVAGVRIDAIGKVTLDKEGAIVAARAAYDALSADEKQQITNLAVLEEAEKLLGELKTAENAYHTVTFTDGGTILSEVTVKDGESVTVSAPTRETSQFTEYTFEKWVDEYGSDVSLDNITADITVYALYATKCVHPFTDLKSGSYYTEAVEWALMNGVMNGTAATKFAPDAVTDRAMIVTVLYRLQGSPDVSRVKTPFTDVKAGDWYADAIAWAYSTGVVNGNSATTFDPKGKLTREQFATILYRYAKEVECEDVSVDDTTALDKYKDKGKISGYAKEAVLWANVSGLIGGVSATKLDPKSGATRAQMATILYRFNGR